MKHMAKKLPMMEEKLSTWLTWKEPLGREIIKSIRRIVKVVLPPNKTMSHMEIYDLGS